MRGIDKNPTKIVINLNCNNINKLKKSNKIKKNTASSIDNFLEVSGLEDVLIIFLSIFISTISFIIHPALLIKNDPIKKSMYNLKFISVFNNDSPNQHGHIKSKKPIGLLNRINSNK